MATSNGVGGSPLLELDHYTDESNAWHFYGYTLTTHRMQSTAEDGSIEFPYQAVAAAIAVAFFRTTVYSTREPWVIRYLFGILLAALTYARKSYELIFAVEIFSYSFVVLAALQSRWNIKASLDRFLYGMIGLLSAAGLSYMLAHCLVTGILLELFQVITPNFIIRGLYYLIPIQECMDAYEMIQSLALPQDILPSQLAHLLFVTFHIQTGMGFLGIHFLKKEQERRNLLVRMDVSNEEEDEKDIASADGVNGTKEGSKATTSNTATTKEAKKAAAKMARSRRFQRTAIPFIFRTALPYMLQIIAYGNLNFFCFHCLCHDLHRTVRWHQTLAHDAHWMAMTQTPVSPEGK